MLYYTLLTLITIVIIIIIRAFCGFRTSIKSLARYSLVNKNTYIARAPMRDIKYIYSPYTI